MRPNRERPSLAGASGEEMGQRPAPVKPSAQNTRSAGGNVGAQHTPEGSSSDRTSLKGSDYLDGALCEWCDRPAKFEVSGMLGDKPATFRACAEHKRRLAA